MKLLCIIFSVYIVFLSVRPCCANECLVKGSNQTELGSKSRSKECLGCSPFFSCGTCVGFVLVSPVQHAVKLTTESKVEHNSPYASPFLKPVSLSIWQPPQIG